jgi:hypothetical protein
LKKFLFQQAPNLQTTNKKVNSNSLDDFDQMPIPNWFGRKKLANVGFASHTARREMKFFIQFMGLVS